MKTCRTCSIEMELSNYYFNNQTQKYNTECKECTKNRSRKCAIENKGKIKDRNRQIYVEKVHSKGRLLDDERLAQPDGTKVCRDCYEKLPVDDFGKLTKSKDGLNPRCKKCRNKSLIKYRENNKDKIKVSSRRYSQKVLHKINSNTAIRRSKKKKATPNWLTYRQRKDLRLFYKLSKKLEKETGQRHNVDHIIPLQNDEVCGLHVTWNLQVITRKDNLIKINKLLDDSELEICYNRNREQLSSMKEGVCDD